MNVKPASGYYDFSISVEGDKRFIANKVEVGMLSAGVFIPCLFTETAWYLYPLGMLPVIWHFYHVFSAVHWILTQDYNQ